MFLSRTARSGSRLLQSISSVQTRGMAGEGIRGLKEHESAVENFYFNKEEERLLRKLLTKVKAQSDAKDEPAAAGVLAAELAALKKIVGNYNMSATDINSLMDWKHKVF